MTINKWTLVLVAAGVVTFPVDGLSEEAMNPISTALSSTSISGYVSTSAHWDLGTGNNNPPAYAFNGGKQDGFNLNVVNLQIQSPVDDSRWAAGYKVDLLFGPDANEYGTQSTGVATDFGVKEAYVELRAPVGNGVGIKMGVFDGVLGYETTHAGSNANYTRSYGYTIEPISQTGILVSYDLCNEFSMSAGVANTFGPMINERAGSAGNPRAESYKSYMATFVFTAPESWGWCGGSTVYGGVVNGFDRFTSGDGVTEVSFNQTSWFVGSTVKTPFEGLMLGASYDYAGVHDGSSSLGSSLYANAAAIYASYRATEKLSVHARGEYYWRSPFEVGFGMPPGGSPGSTFYPGVLPSKALGVTGTVQYDLWANVISRLEFRWDHAADGDNHFGGSPAFVGGPGPTKKNAYLLAANLIYQF